MEELAELIVPFIFIIIAFLSKVKGKKTAKPKYSASFSKGNQTAENLHKMRSELEAAVQKKAADETKATAAAEQVSFEDHFHEGRQDVPCPAVEREAPRPRPSEQKMPAAAPAVPGIKLSFDQNSVVHGFVMSEILNRPRPGTRR